MTPQLLLESAIRALVLGAGAWGLLRLLRVRNSTHERVVWLIVLSAATLMPFATSLVTRLIPDAGSGISRIFIVRELVPAAFGLVSAAEGTNDWIRTLADAFWRAYLCVSALLLARLGVGLFVIRRLWRAATPVAALSAAGVPVRSTHRLDTPVVTNAGILVPENWTQWTPQQRSYVLAHETSHLARNDFHWHLLARLHLATFWASPLSWWLLRKITLLAEQLSDDAAVARSGRPAEYAAVLLEFSVGRRNAMLAVGMARSAELSNRIERILGASRPGADRRGSWTVLTPGIVTVALLSILSPWLRVSQSVRRVTSPDASRVVPDAIGLRASGDGESAHSSESPRRRRRASDVSAQQAAQRHSPPNRLRAATTSSSSSTHPRIGRMATLAPLAGRMTRLAPLIDRGK